MTTPQTFSRKRTDRPAHIGENGMEVGSPERYGSLVGEYVNRDLPGMRPAGVGLFVGPSSALTQVRSPFDTVVHLGSFDAEDLWPSWAVDCQRLRVWPADSDGRWSVEDFDEVVPMVISALAEDKRVLIVDDDGLGAAPLVAAASLLILNEATDLYDALRRSFPPNTAPGSESASLVDAWVRRRSRFFQEMGDRFPDAEIPFGIRHAQGMSLSEGFLANQTDAENDPWAGVMLQEARERPYLRLKPAGWTHRRMTKATGSKVAFAKSSEAPTLGVNMAKLGKALAVGTPEACYGQDADQWTDYSSLGAKVLRQYGYPDMKWRSLDELTAVLSLGGLGPDIPTELDSIEALFGDASAGPSSDTTGSFVQNYAGDLVVLLEQARSNAIRLVPTFLTTGASTEPSTIPMTGVSLPIPITWDSGHEGHNLGKFVFTANGLDDLWSCLFRAVTTSLSWTAGTDFRQLDIRQNYQLAYIALIGHATAVSWCEAFTELESVVGEDVTASDLIDRIEIFNEIDVRNIVVDAGGDPLVEDSATDWARAWFASVIAMREVFESEHRSIEFFLPGIACYRTDERTDPWDPWDYKTAFLNAFLTALEELCDSYSKCSGSPLNVGDLVAGVDYHWYHREVEEKIPIVRLCTEVAELRDIFESHGLRAARVTVCETGTSSAEPKEILPPIFCPVGVDRGDYQAWEVWRRLAGALAAGADGAAWHAWMSGVGAPIGAWNQHGLRLERGVVSDARDSTQKVSWFAFQRLASLLGSIHGGRVVYPYYWSWAGRYVSLSAPGLVVLMFSVSFTSGDWAGFTRAYLLFVDTNHVDTSVSYAVHLRNRSGSLLRLQTFDPITTDVSAGSETELPVSSVATGGYTDATITGTDDPGGYEVTVSSWEPPTLFLSTDAVNVRAGRGLPAIFPV